MTRHFEISKIVNKVTKSTRAVKKVVSYLQRARLFLVPKVFLIFGGPITKFLLKWFLILKGISEVNFSSVT